MSSITRYKCSKDCGLNVSLRHGFPIWREDTPEEKQGIPVGIINEEYVIGYFNEEVCLSCREIVKIADIEAYAWLEYKRAKKLWDEQNILRKIGNVFTGTTPPKQEVILGILNACPKCRQSNFLTLGEECHLCGTGQVNSDKRKDWVF